MGSTCSRKEKKMKLVWKFKASRLGNYPNSFLVFGLVGVGFYGLFCFGGNFPMKKNKNASFLEDQQLSS